MPGAIAHPIDRLTGGLRAPGDKSLSHRALMLAAACVGETRITGLLEAEDVQATAAALQALGADIGRSEAGAWRVSGVGVGGMTSPAAPLDLGNSGTGARLLMGLLASQPVTAVFTGDASLSARPMERVMAPLSAMGARFAARAGGRLPITLEGSGDPLPIDYAMPVASAQVKSAILLATLNTPGTTVVTESLPTRDHSERMLAALGAEIAVEPLGDSGRRIALTGEAELAAPGVLAVPGDISAAAFPLVAAAITGGKVTVEGVGVNPLRAGLLTALEAMGAPVRQDNASALAGEPVADLTLKAPDGLAGIDLDPANAPAMIDEFPILFIAAACAAGRSRFTGLSELRVKESDRLRVMAEGLAACGVKVEELDDGLIIEGAAGAPPGGVKVAAQGDHRVAMAFLVLGLAAQAPVAVDDIAPIATSFPGFIAAMSDLGARIECCEADAISM